MKNIYFAKYKLFVGKNEIVEINKIEIKETRKKFKNQELVL